MPRPDKKATKIIFNILGTPANLAKNRETAKERKLNARLNWEESRLVR